MIYQTDEEEERNEAIEKLFEALDPKHQIDIDVVLGYAKIRIEDVKTTYNNVIRPSRYPLAQLCLYSDYIGDVVDRSIEKFVREELPEMLNSGLIVEADGFPGALGFYFLADKQTVQNSEVSIWELDQLTELLTELAMGNVYVIGEHIDKVEREEKEKALEYDMNYIADAIGERIDNLLELEQEVVIEEEDTWVKELTYDLLTYPENEEIYQDSGGGQYSLNLEELIPDTNAVNVIILSHIVQPQVEIIGKKEKEEAMRLIAELWPEVDNKDRRIPTTYRIVAEQEVSSNPLEYTDQIMMINQDIGIKEDDTLILYDGYHYFKSSVTQKTYKITTSAAKTKEYYSRLGFCKHTAHYRMLSDHKSLMNWLLGYYEEIWRYVYVGIDKLNCEEGEWEPDNAIVIEASYSKDFGLTIFETVREYFTVYVSDDTLNRMIYSALDRE